MASAFLNRALHHTGRKAGSGLQCTWVSSCAENRTKNRESVMLDYDIAIIGAGVIGASVARFLSQYHARICVIERNNDVCEGTSKANSAIIHAGHDAETGSLKAKLNLKGNQMMDQIASELDIPFKRNGALVVCLDHGDLPALQSLYQKGLANGVEGLELLDRTQALAREPMLSDRVVAALYASTSGIICPFELTLGFAENAAANGVEFLLGTTVTNLTRSTGGYQIETDEKTISCRAVINAAGVYSDQIHNMICDAPLSVIPRRGEYILLDRTAGGHVSHTIFQLPGKYGKGILVTPTVHGNLLTGPTAEDIDGREDTRTTQNGLADVLIKAAYAVRDIPFRQAITSFSGLRSHLAQDDFYIRESADCFFDAAGIESPGLTASPAIGIYLSDLVADRLKLKRNEGFQPIRKRILPLKELPYEIRQQKISERPEYGEIICRCEEISEGEIMDAIHRPLGATTLDGVKRRIRAGMGRCQSGFCSPRVMEIIVRETGRTMQDIRKNQDGSWIVCSTTRGDAQ